jgi:hypothetical protein
VLVLRAEAQHLSLVLNSAVRTRVYVCYYVLIFCLEEVEDLKVSTRNSKMAIWAQGIFVGSRLERRKKTSHKPVAVAVAYAVGQPGSAALGGQIGNFTMIGTHQAASQVAAGHLIVNRSNCINVSARAGGGAVRGCRRGEAGGGWGGGNAQRRPAVATRLGTCIRTSVALSAC